MSLENVNNSLNELRPTDESFLTIDMNRKIIEGEVIVIDFNPLNEFGGYCVKLEFVSEFGDYAVFHKKLDKDRLKTIDSIDSEWSDMQIDSSQIIDILQLNDSTDNECDSEFESYWGAKPTASLPSIDTMIQLWNQIYPYLDQIGTLLGLASIGIQFGSWLKSKFSKEHSPSSLLEFIVNKKVWSSHELSLALGISRDESKNLLKGFGYKWDRKKQVYIQTDTTKIINLTLATNIDKISKDIMSDEW